MVKDKTKDTYHETMFLSSSERIPYTVIRGPEPLDRATPSTLLINALTGSRTPDTHPKGLNR